MNGSNTDPGAARYQLEVDLLHLAQTAEGHRLHLKLTLPDHVQHFEQQLETIGCEVSYQKLILSFWGDTYAQSWHVINFTSTFNRIELQVSRHSGRLMGSLLIQADLADHLPIQAQPRRAEFHKRLLNLIKHTFPSVQIQRATLYQSPAGHRSASFSRVWLTSQNHRWLAIGVNPGELRSVQNQVVAAVLEMATHSLKSGIPVARAIIFAPPGCIDPINRQIRLIRGLNLELFELDLTSTAARPISSRTTQPALFTGPVSQFFQTPEVTCLLTEGECQDLSRVQALSPTTIAFCQSPSQAWISIRWNGLEFARLIRETPDSPAHLRFGISAFRQPLRQLTPDSQKRFTNLIQLLRKHRTGESSDRRHPLYRLQTERWLESIIQRGISQLDPTLQPHTVAEQVAAFNLTEGGFVDLLGVRKNGQLALFELKARADPQQLWQGLEYWYRVQNHLQRGDMNRHPAFASFHISSSLPPVLFLIAPMLDLHPATVDHLSWIDPVVPIQVIGIGQHWRQSLQVIFRKSNQ